MSIVDKIDSLIRMIEIRDEMNASNKDICSAHEEGIDIEDSENFNICEGINCSDCVFYSLHREETITALEDLKKLAALNELITPTK